jgi:hypothetical protein
MSDGIKGMISKFMHFFEEGSYIITKLLYHSAYKLRDERGKLRGDFNIRELRLSQADDDETQMHK